MLSKLMFVVVCASVAVAGANEDAQRAFLRAVDARHVNSPRSLASNPEGDCPKLTAEEVTSGCALQIPSGWPGAGTCIASSSLKPGYYCSIGATVLGVSKDSGPLCDCPAMWKCKADKANVKISLGFAGHISLNMGMCIIPWYTFVVGILICLFIVAAGFHLIRCLFCGARDTYEKF